MCSACCLKFDNLVTSLLLFVVSLLLLVVCCVLVAVSCLLCVVCCLLFLLVSYCLSYAHCFLVFGVCCSLL